MKKKLKLSKLQREINQKDLSLISKIELIKHILKFTFTLNSYIDSDTANFCAHEQKVPDR